MEEGEGKRIYRVSILNISLLIALLFTLSISLFLDILDEEGVEGGGRRRGKGLYRVSNVEIYHLRIALLFTLFIYLFLDILDEEGVEGGGEGRDYIESPMSDGTIEEDFEEALAR